MFDFMKKKTPPEEQAQALCGALVPLWCEAARLARDIGDASYLEHEAGLFVGIVALRELERHGRPADKALREAFVAHWIIRLADNPNEADAPDDRELTARLFAQYPRYCAIEESIDASPGSWALELARNCMDDAEAERLAQWLPAAPVLARLTAGIRRHAAAAARS